MKLMVLSLTLLTAVTLSATARDVLWSAQLDFPNIRRYPPGYYGAAYYSPHQYPRGATPSGPQDPLKWDKAMSHELGIDFPFYPIPYPWDYGRELNFNFPDFNSNDWR